VVGEAAAGFETRERWAAVVEHRDRALRVARARCSDRSAVDDCVQEAMARVVAMPNLDLSRVGPLLSVVVANVAADVHRGQARTRSLGVKLGAAVRPDPSPDDHVCDQAEARWLARQAESLPSQDRAVLLLRAEGMTVAEAATYLGITYKAAESSFTRARKALKAAWRATLGVLAALLGRPSRDHERPVVLVSAAGAVAVTCALAWWPPESVADAPAVVSVRPPPAAAVPVVAAPAKATVAQPPAAVTPPPITTSQRGPAAQPVAAPTEGGPVVTSVAEVERPAVGPIDKGGTRVTYEDSGESFVDTVNRCLSEGVIVTPTHIECR